MRWTIAGRARRAARRTFALLGAALAAGIACHGSPATQTLPPDSRAVELRVYMDLPVPGPIAAPGLIATYPIAD